MIICFTRPPLVFDVFLNSKVNTERDSVQVNLKNIKQWSSGIILNIRIDIVGTIFNINYDLLMLRLLSLKFVQILTIVYNVELA